MYYEINVAKDGAHFFATHKRSITSTSRMLEIYEVLRRKFPEVEGYTILVTKEVEYSELVHTNELNELLLKEER